MYTDIKGFQMLGMDSMFGIRKINPLNRSCSESWMKINPLNRSCSESWTDFHPVNQTCSEYLMDFRSGYFTTGIGFVWLSPPYDLIKNFSKKIIESFLVSSVSWFSKKFVDSFLYHSFHIHRNFTKKLPHYFTNLSITDSTKQLNIPSYSPLHKFYKKIMNLFTDSTLYSIIPILLLKQLYDSFMNLLNVSLSTPLHSYFIYYLDSFLPLYRFLNYPLTLCMGIFTSLYRFCFCYLIDSFTFGEA